MDYEDKNGNYEQEYPSWMEENNYVEDDDSDFCEECESLNCKCETDNEDDPDMYPKDEERDQLDYPHNQPLMY